MLFAGKRLLGNSRVSVHTGWIQGAEVRGCCRLKQRPGIFLWCQMCTDGENVCQAVYVRPSVHPSVRPADDRPDRSGNSRTRHRRAGLPGQRRSVHWFRLPRPLRPGHTVRRGLPRTCVSKVDCANNRWPSPVYQHGYPPSQPPARLSIRPFIRPTASDRLSVRPSVRLPIPFSSYTSPPPAVFVSRQRPAVTRNVGCSRRVL